MRGHLSIFSFKTGITHSTRNLPSLNTEPPNNVISAIPQRSGRNALAILALAALFLGGYAVLVHFEGVGAELAESNLQSNLIRISRYLREKPAPIILAGSSVAGRLLPAYFREQGIEVQNLGLDGSRPLFAFEVIRMRPGLPPTILVDTSTLFQPLMENDATLRGAIHSTGWKLATFFPPMRPENRPSSILYFRVKARKESATLGQELPPHRNEEMADVKSTARNRTQTWSPEDQYPPVRAALSDFQKDGCSVVLLNIPRGAGWGEIAPPMVRQLAADLNLPLWEIGRSMAGEQEILRFSDGMHLDVPSARKVAVKVAGSFRQTAHPTQSSTKPGP